MTARQLERGVIALVAAHSLCLGFVMLLFPNWALAQAGMPAEARSFFPSQSGLFLIILGGAYLMAVWRRPFAWLLVASKASAVLFLLTHYLLDGATVLIPAALFDGCMGIAVATVVIRSARAEIVPPRA